MLVRIWLFSGLGAGGGGGGRSCLQGGCRSAGFRVQVE